MKTVRKIWEGVTTILVALVVILAVLLVGVRLFGLQVFTVLSGSMEPTYHTGALIYVKEVDYKEIEPGQVITFMLDEKTIATHRVVEVVPDDEDPSVLRYKTKGDANEAEDGSLVHYKNVLGTPVFTIPYLGYLANFIQHPPGMYIAISAGAILLILVFLPDILFDDEEEKNGKEKEKKEKTDKEKKKAAEAAIEENMEAAGTEIESSGEDTDQESGEEKEDAGASS
ncbi:signal peptidase I [Porcincola intestinalis]|uniref:signal peptidase I n=1 Tax=Porcincola intestinalis TaxID=2606632 RepID=UPI002A814AF1|nr:signal peptidase I [Porcincola intestinalis]MDY4203947.1 signal peptidase I [Porcincola intestinalis]